MIGEIKVVSITLFISILTTFVSCGKPQDGWKGKIEEVDGVMVVKNPKKPMYSEDIFNICPSTNRCIGNSNPWKLSLST